MISIIIPTYNEAKNISELVKKLNKILSKIPHEIIVVDDDSPDRTWKIAEELPREHKVKVLRRKKERGLATAVVAGFKVAKGSVLGVMDADLSHPPELSLKLIKSIQEKGYDIAIGSRHVKGGKTEEWPLIRGLISKLAILLAKPLTKVKDSQSGYFFLKKKVVENVKLSPVGYKILLEILVKGHYKTFKEIPYVFLNRSFGRSKIGLKVYLEYIQHILRLYLYKLSGNS